MKKVIHLIWRFDNGGIESFVINLLKSLNPSKYKQDFVVCGGNNLPQEKEVEQLGSVIYHLPTIEGESGKRNYLDELKKFLRNNKYDIIHSHLGWMNINTLKVAMQLGIKTRVSHVHTVGYEKNFFKRFVKQIAINRYSTDLIACSSKSKINYYGHFNKKAQIIYSGIDVKKFYNISNKNNKNFIICARVCDAKNPKFILDTIHELSILDPEYSFKWIGGGDLTEYHHYNEEGSPLEHIGFTNNVCQYYKDASYMLMPSKMEGFGTSAIEAQISGIWVFASNNLPKDTNLGLISYWPLELEPKAWARRIHDFISNQESLNYNLSINKLSEYDFSIISSLIEKIYSQFR